MKLEMNFLPMFGLLDICEANGTPETLENGGEDNFDILEMPVEGPNSSKIKRKSRIPLSRGCRLGYIGGQPATTLQAAK